MFKKKVPQTGGETVLGRRSVTQLKDRLLNQYNLNSKICDIILGKRKKKDLKIFSVKFETKETNRGILYRQEFEGESSFYLDKSLQDGDNLKHEKVQSDILESVSPTFNLDFKPNVSNIVKYPAVIPLFFEFGSGKIFPTLQLIWIYGSIFVLPKIIVLDHVKTYILNGADLMAGGVLFDESIGIEGIKKDQIWVIKCRSDEHPIAIGISLVDWNQIETPELRKGKVFKVIHHCNDALSAEGNFEFSTQKKKVEELTVDNLNSAITEKVSINDNIGIETKDQKEDIVIDKNKYDFLLEVLLFQVLDSLKDSKSVLPLDSSAIWDRMSRLSLRIYGIPLDIKNSSYIKISKFFQHYNKTGILAIKQNRIGIMNIVEINIEKISLKEKDNSTNCIFAELELIRKRKLKTEVGRESNSLSNNNFSGRAKNTNNSEGNSQSMEVINIYQPNSNLQMVIDYYISNNDSDKFGEIYLLKTSRGEKKQFFISILDARRAIEYYINSNNLRVCDPGSNCNKLTHVKLDETLMSLISNKDNDIIPLSNLFKSIPSFLKPFYYIRNNSFNVNSNENPNIIRGNCKSILIYTESRTGARKFVTIISPYISQFGLNPQEVAESCQKKFACSATASEIKGFPSDLNIGVVIQGNVTDQISDFLSSKWGIPKSFIEVR